MAFDWGSVIGAAVSLYGANRASSDAKDAGKQSAQGSQAAIDLSRDIYNDQRNLNMPAYNAGNTARDQYMRMLGLPVGGGSTGAQGGVGATPGATSTPTQWYGNQSGTPTVNAQLYASDPTYKRAWDETVATHQQNHGRGYNGDSDRGILQQNMQNLYAQYAPKPAAQTPSAAAPAQSLNDIYGQWRNTPGYQFGLQEGNKSVQASAAARGGLNSGATMKALQKFGTDYADQQGYRPYMNDLSNLFGGAQTAASNIGSAGQSYGSQAGAAYQNQGNARAQSTYDSANIWQQGAQQAWKYGNQLGQNQGWWG